MQTSHRKFDVVYITVVVVVFVTNEIKSDFTNTAMQEYCQWEPFKAQCGKDEVVLIDDAVYGRMRYGRCISEDQQHVGCYRNVRALADVRCSGRRDCQIDVPDKLFDGTKPCREDFKLYLMASYTCLKVLTPVGNQCGNVHPENREQPPNPAGYLASTASVSAECGSPQHPWILEFSPGQRINVTLVDFVAVPSTNLTRQSSINLDQHNQHCQVIAVIKEKTPVRSVTICGGGVERERTVYISESHSIEVRLMTISKAASEGGHYLIRYEVIGCSDLKPPRLGWWQRAKDNASLSTFGCTGSGKIWHLTCQDRKWIGEQDESSCGGPDHYGSGRLSSPSPNFLISHFTAVTVIVCIAASVGTLIFLVGLYYIKKQRQLSRKNKMPQLQQPYSLKRDNYSTEKVVCSQQQSHLSASLVQSPYHHPSRIDAYEMDDNEYAYVEDLQLPVSGCDNMRTRNNNNAYGLLSQRQQRQQQIDCFPARQYREFDQTIANQMSFDGSQNVADIQGGARHQYCTMERENCRSNSLPKDFL